MAMDSTQEFVDRLVDDVITELRRDRRIAGLSPRDLQLLLEDVRQRASEVLEAAIEHQQQTHERISQ